MGKRKYSGKEVKEYQREIMAVMYGVWSYIGSDSLQMVEENDGRSYMTRDEVVEMVTDAGRTLQELKGEVREYYESLPYKQVQGIARRAFPYARYS